MSRARAALALAALLAAVLGLAWATGALEALERAREARRARASVSAVTAEVFDPVLASPAFQARAQGLSPAQQQALLFELARDGLPRLPDDVLLERLALLREVAARGDERTCALVLIGGTPDAANDLLASLDADALRRWLLLSRDAVEASLRDAPARLLTAEEAERARTALAAALAPEQAARLAGPLADLAQRDACALARATLDGAASLPAEERQLVARLFAGG